jgi:cytochrome c553
MPAERRRRLPAVAAALLLAAGAAPAQPRPELLAACAACHGPGGNPALAGMPALAGQPRLFLENQLVLIREGLREVPTMQDVVKGLSDEEIGALARHFAAQELAPRAGRVREAPYRRGARLSGQALCGSCHLPDYRGQQQVPRLAGQDESYLLQAMKQFRDHAGPGRDTIMAATLRGMGDADLADLAHYLAHHPANGQAGAAAN